MEQFWEKKRLNYFYSVPIFSDITLTPEGVRVIGYLKALLLKKLD